MRIISQFSDYYDCIQQYGFDDDITYLRKEETITLSNFSINRAIYVGFCGTIYPGLRFALPLDGMQTVTKFHYIFSLEDLDKTAKTWKKDEQKHYFESQRVRTRHSFGRYYNRPSSRSEYEKWFLGQASDRWQSNNWREAYTPYFEKHKVPIFVIESGGKDTGHLILNANLRSRQFYRIVNPQQAFQTLEMYLSNVARPEKEIPPVSDKDLVEAKGFDRLSFRKSKKE